MRSTDILLTGSVALTLCSGGKNPRGETRVSAMLLQASVDPCPPDRGWGSQSPARPHFSCRSTGITGPEPGDLAQLLCGAPPTCGPSLLLPPQRALIVPGDFCRCQGGLFSSSPSPSPTPMQVGGLCWGHFKLVFSLLSLVARRISSPGPSHWPCVLPAGVGAAFFWGGGFGKQRIRCKGGTSLLWATLKD